MLIANSRNLTLRSGLCWSLFGLLTLGSICPSYAEDTVQTIYLNEAKKCNDLGCIRREIDKINEDFLHLLAKRTAYVQRAGDLKRPTKVADDPKRVADQLNTLLEKAEKLDLPKEVWVDAFKLIMKNSIEFQQRYIDKK